MCLSPIMALLVFVGCLLITNSCVWFQWLVLDNLSKMPMHKINTDFGFCTLVSNVFRIGLIILFIIHLFYSIEKFSNLGTTDVKTAFYSNEVFMPAISICRKGFKNSSLENFEYDILASMDMVCLEVMRSVIPGLNTTQMTLNTTAALDLNDVWNRCMMMKYYNKTDTFDKINLISGNGAFWTNISNITDESKFQIVPFTSRHGHCFMLKPFYNLTMRTNFNESVIMLRMPPGMYTMMIHDPAVIPVGISIEESYRISPINLFIPNVNTPNGTMQYATISMMETSLVIPKLLSKLIFWGMKGCVNNATWHNNLQMAVVKKVGCQLAMENWYPVTNTTQYCKTRREYDNYFSNMSQLNNYLSLVDISKMYNIPTLCSARSILASIDRKPALVPKDFPLIETRTNVNNTGSFVMFFYNSSRVSIIQEKTFYDGANLVGDVGGALYLLVALSLAHSIKIFKLGGKTFSNRTYRK